MSAAVVAYSAAPEDERLTLKVECLSCGVEWGWSTDSLAANERLEEMAERHNVEQHGHRPGAQQEPR